MSSDDPTPDAVDTESPYPPDIITIDDRSPGINLYRTTLDGKSLPRTLSEEFHDKSPLTQAYVKAHTQNVTPTTNDRKQSYNCDDIKERSESVYMKSESHEREIMAFYGIVSHTFHSNKYKCSQREKGEGRGAENGTKKGNGGSNTATE